MIETHELSPDVVKAYDEAIESLLRALELKDPGSSDHSRRMAEMSVKLARKLDFPESNIEIIHRGGLLHDIGKLGLPDAILLKPGPLTSEELIISRRHVHDGVFLISNVAFFQPLYPMILYHHEKWDGSGYPKGLRGEEIPFSARIVQVPGVWDALTSDRPYRGAYSKAAAIQMMREERGKYFDPKVLDAFLTLVDGAGSPTAT